MSEKDVKEELASLIKMRDSQVNLERKMNQSEIQRIGKRGETYSKQMSVILKKQRIDVSSIMEVEESRSKTAEIETANIRKILVKSKPDTSLNPTNFEKIQSVFYPPQIVLPYYTQVYGGSGVSGYDIGDIHEFAKSVGSGWGCWAHGYLDPQVTIDRWYTFVPPKTGYYTLQVFQPFNGFYICRSDDGFWTCKYAWLRVESSLIAYQYFWHAERRYTLLSIGSDNIDTYGRFDGPVPTVYGDTFAVGDRAYLLVTQRLRCDTSGGGSYAEINFKEGIANALHAPLLIVIPPT